MLILGRKEGEIILIGDDITIKVIDICRGSVRIGIDAPKNVAVYRKELLDARIEKDASVDPVTN